MNSGKQQTEDRNMTTENAERLLEKVRQCYGRIAEGAESGCCTSADREQFADAEASTAQRIGYDPGELAAVPEEANLGLGCGAPIASLALRPGEVVLDLGSGGGLDAFLAASRVGPTGCVIGIDMTPGMIERACTNARKAGLTNVEFRQGRLEALPVPDASIDAVTSNCVINLVPDKRQVFREIHRVLRPGGRLVVSDIVLDGPLPQAVVDNVLAYVGCVAGAMQRTTYFDTIEQVGLGGIRILRDVDFLETIDKDSHKELFDLARSTGATAKELEGMVRSVTFRAGKA